MIHKSARDLHVEPNLADYDAVRASFSWQEMAQRLDGLPGGGRNIAYEALDRHAEGADRNRVALRFLSADATRDVTFADLYRSACRFTNVLRSLGIGKGDRLFVLAGRIPELYVAMLGALRNGTVVTPMFSAFGPEPVAARMRLGGARVLVTTDRLYQRKVAPIREQIPTLEYVLAVPTGTVDGPLPDTIDFDAVMRSVDDQADIEPTGPEDPALLHFTSGTTGRPKGAVHVHDAVVTHYATGLYALDLHADDIFWCTADPGWVTGTSYGVIAPLVHGVTSIVDDEDFDAERWYRNLEKFRVSVWYTAPTAIRMLMKSGNQAVRGHDFPALRFVSSVGEPLGPDAVVWGDEVLGRPVHDNWWQTETGGIMIANTAAQDIKPGSMGRPLPGVDAAVVQRCPGGRVEEVTTADTDGELALKAGWPSMFRGYLDDEERYRKCFADGWYLTGDLVRRDTDGYFWFVGRSDDVIKSAGHLIGPFEVENVLTEHSAVIEAAVIGKPDPLVGEVVKAFVMLTPGNTKPSDVIRRELIAHARIRLGASIAPKEIEFVEELPHTRSGKTMRRLLKARELGLPEGDISTLETPAGAQQGST
ncbi:acetate--CoA ligase [Rhodococcus sp. WMMA185]|uniref:acetate--CoA ligase n=1 Tax=Rhodococcus sp. WMMA185 TaxID=679318 RepID=UPI000877FAA2|nr:acetate--CoA ligase [Rhodococcus sp. WMMA185]AOW93621.1 acetate--CoA ligase [Rhodococcus sp. WMMA185]